MILPSDIWHHAYAPPDRRSIEAWAPDNITLPPVLSRRGKFSIEGSRQFIGPLQALRSDRVRGVRVLKPVRGGGTLIADVFVPWVIVNISASVLWVFQDDAIAKAHAETRQMPILKSVPAIRSMLPANRHHDRTQDIIFNNGLPFTMQGPALGGLQARGFQVAIGDEIWMWKQGVLVQLKARMGDFVKSASNKFLGISQGGEEESDWFFEYKEGVEFVLHVHCAGCDKLLAPEWTMKRADGSVAGAVFDSVKHEDGTYDKDASAATVRFVCPHCGHEHPNSEKTRSDWNKTCEYVNTKTGAIWDASSPPTETSFRWHSLIDYPWFDLVKEWLSAQEAKHVGNFGPLVAFLQKRCTQFRSERTIHDGDLPFARANISLLDPKDKAWPEEAGRFLTADRQSEDTYWVMIRAWAKTAESRRLFYGKLFSEAAIEAKREEFAVNPDCTVVDSGYRPKGDHGVYAACIRYGWMAAKGTDDAFFFHAEQRADGSTDRVQKPWAPLSFGDPGEGTTEQGRGRAPLIRFSAPTCADRVLELVQAGLWVEPDGDENDESEREYRRQMTSEFKRPKVDKFTGKKVMVYVCPSGNNHAFDCSKMQVLCAMHAGFLPSGIDNEKPKEKNDS